MSTLRPLLGALALTALLAARTVPDLAEELVLSAASTLSSAEIGSVVLDAAAPLCTGSRP